MRRIIAVCLAFVAERGDDVHSLLLNRATRSPEFSAHQIVLGRCLAIGCQRIAPIMPCRRAIHRLQGAKETWFATLFEHEWLCGMTVA